jgi:hypothetical protein
MKKLFLLFAQVVIGHIIAVSQICPTGDVTFSFQSQIDEFQWTYPGCKAIAGELTINGSDITNLNGLSGLFSVEGNLSVGSLINGGNPLLDHIEGLNNLNFVGGSLIIALNNSLTSLEGLGGLNAVAGDLHIRNNCSLADLSGLGNLTNIGGTLFIENNVALTHLSGLDNLNSIAGDLYIGYNLLLTSLEGLSNVTFTGGEISIYFNNHLTNLNGLEGLTSTGALYIMGNSVLSDLSGLENLESIDGSLWIGGINPQSSNTSLISLTGLSKLTSVGKNLVINYNPNLTSLIGLNQLKSIGGKLSLHFNDKLTSLSGLDSISAGSISGLDITDNNSLSICEISNICGFIFDSTEEVVIKDNSTGCNSLEELKIACGYNSVNELSVMESVSIYPNPCSDQFTITFNLTQQGMVKIEMYNNVGQRVLTNSDRFLIQGYYEVSCDLTSLPSGIYYCSLISNDQVIQKKIIRL